MKATYKGIEFELEGEADVKALLNIANETEEVEVEQFGAELSSEKDKLMEELKEINNNNRLIKEKKKKKKYAKRHMSRPSHKNAKRIKRFCRDSWSKADEDFLLENKGKMKMKKIAKQLHRTRLACQVRWGRLTRTDRTGKLKPKSPIMNMNSFGKKRWSKIELKYVADNKGLKSLKQIAQELGRSYDSVRIKSIRAKVREPKFRKSKRQPAPVQPATRSHKFFTGEDDAFIKKNVANMNYIELAKALNRSMSSVYCRAILLGVAKSKYKKKQNQPVINVPKPKQKIIYDEPSVSTGNAQALSDLIISCAQTKKPLGTSDLMGLLDMSEAEAKSILVDIFNGQENIMAKAKLNRKITWNGYFLSFR